MFSVRTILHPTDFSPSAEEAFQLAEALAGGRHSHLVVLHVLPATGSVVFSGKTRVQVRTEDDRDRCREALRQLRTSDPRVAVEYRLVEGVVAAEILCAANQSHADLIVMGSRGRTSLERLALGSVADQIMRQAPCQVVTVSAAPVAHTSPVSPMRAESLPGQGAGVCLLTESVKDRGLCDAQYHTARPLGTAGNEIVEPVGSADP